MGPVCCGCCHEMKCVKNGVLIEINQHHFYSGDKYRCETCDRSVVVNLGTPFTPAYPLDTIDSPVEIIKLEQ